MKADKIYTGRSTIRMFNADCMDFLNECEENQYELAIVDVQYGIGEDGSKNHTRGKLAVSKNYKPYKSGDDEPPSKEYWDLLNKASKEKIIWGANHFISRFPKDSSSWIVWDKDNGKTDFADCELALTTHERSVRKFTHKWQGMLQHDMKNKQLRIHPNEKPIRLYKWLLQNYANEGDTILDTHGGSMSIAIACWEEGFDLDIIELDEDYFNDAVKRFEQHASQVQLF